MTYYWMLLVAFVCGLSALPQIIKRLHNKKEMSDVLELIGIIALAVAVICYTIGQFENRVG